MRKIYLKIEAELIIRADDDADLDDVLSSLLVSSGDDKADVEYFVVTDSEVTDSK